MQTTTELKPLERVRAGALIVPVFEGVAEERFGAGELSAGGEVTGKSLELTLLHHPPGVDAQRVLLAGAGKLEKFDAAELRRLVGAAVRHLKSKSIREIAVALDARSSGEEFVSAAVEGAILGDYEPDRYKTDDDKKSVASFTVVAAPETPGLAAAVERGRILAEAQNFTRGLVNEPANRLTPMKVAEAARQMASEYRSGMRSPGSRAHGEARHGRAAGRGAGKRRAAGADRSALPAGERPRAKRIWDWWAKE